MNDSCTYSFLYGLTATIRDQANGVIYLSAHRQTTCNKILHKLPSLHDADKLKLVQN